MVTKKKRGQEGASKNQLLSGIVAIEDHFQFEHAVFVLNMCREGFLFLPCNN
jgi:hypothetical protein